jgi:hypothetical protein
MWACERQGNTSFFERVIGIGPEIIFCKEYAIMILCNYDFIFSMLAFIATTMVLTLIRAAPAAGLTYNRKRQTTQIPLF